MPESALVSPQAFIEAMHERALELGGEEFRTGEDDGFKLARSRTSNKTSSEEHFEFEACRDADPDTGIVADTTYEFHHGVTVPLMSLPEEVQGTLDFDLMDIEVETGFAVSNCTTYYLSTSLCSLDITTAANFFADDDHLVTVPVVEGQYFWGDPEDIEEHPMKVEGLTICTYRLPGSSDELFRQLMPQQPDDLDAFLRDIVGEPECPAQQKLQRMAEIFAKLRC